MLRCRSCQPPVQGLEQGVTELHSSHIQSIGTAKVDVSVVVSVLAKDVKVLESVLVWEVFTVLTMLELADATF